MMMIENEPDPLRRIPTKRPAEIRAEIGGILRAARLKRGQSLEAVAQQTRISKRFLEALEEDRLDEFPAFVYMRGFLKGYCEHLELNFDEIWAKIEPAAKPDAVSAPLNSASAVQPAAATPAPASAPAPKTPAPKAPAPAPAHPAPKAPEPRHDHAPAHGGNSATVAIALAMILFVGLAVWIFNDRRAAESAKAADTTPRVLMPLPRTVERKVGLRAVEDAWVRASVDGNVVFEGRVPRGAAMEWKPNGVVLLRTTSPDSLQLTVNGNPTKLANPSPEGEYRIDVP